MSAAVAAASLAAAVAFGWSTAAMHFDASGAPTDLPGPMALGRYLLSRWRWLTGMAASLLGLARHALALRLRSLSVVQPLVVSGLVFSMLFRAALDRRQLTRGLLLWSGVTAAGLGVFLTGARSSAGSNTPDQSTAAVGSSPPPSAGGWPARPNRPAKASSSELQPASSSA